MLFVPNLEAAELLSLEVLPCGREGSAGGLAAGPDLTRVTIDIHRYPKALCNDGTPAVFYVRPASRPEDATRWHISLQGGGGRGDGQSCAERWCSADTNFGMDKMGKLGGSWGLTRLSNSRVFPTRCVFPTRSFQLNQSIRVRRETPPYE